MNPGPAPTGEVQEWAWRGSRSEYVSYDDDDHEDYDEFRNYPLSPDVISLFEHEGRWGIGTARSVMWFDDESMARMAWAMGFEYGEEVL